MNINKWEGFPGSHSGSYATNISISQPICFHDISNLIQAGDNAVGVLLGNGWYNHQSIAVWYFDRAPWRTDLFSVWIF